MELESDRKLAFLDYLVTKFGATFNIAVFRKDSFTGLGTSILVSVRLILK